MWFFFDTSAIVKRYHAEKGTEIVNRIFEGIITRKGRCVISALSISEFASALRRKVISKEISWTDFWAAFSAFLHETSYLRVEPIEGNLYAEGLDYILKYGLSSHDSVQLATLIKLHTFLEIPKNKLILVSSDVRLNEAAEGEGFMVVNPETETLERIEEILKADP